MPPRTEAPQCQVKPHSQEATLAGPAHIPGRVSTETEVPGPLAQLQTWNAAGSLPLPLQALCLLPTGLTSCPFLREADLSLLILASSVSKGKKILPITQGNASKSLFLGSK